MSKIKTVLILIVLMLLFGIVGENDRQTEMLEAGYTVEQIN